MRKFYCLLFIILSITLNGYGQCNRMSDSLALVALYNATGGASWTNTWNLNQPMDTWYGVELDNNGCVECLDLDGDNDCAYDCCSFGNNLVGTLPNLNLPNLIKLYLSFNQLSGTIPNFSHLTKLEELTLDDNSLSGIIPNFSNLTSLERLYIRRTQISGNIPNFSNLQSLRILSLSSNQLNGNIPSFTNFPNLQSLVLENNQLDGSIPNLSNLTNLGWLDLSDNQLTGSLPNFVSNPNLVRLICGNNQLTGTIPDFSTTPNIEYISLEENQFDSCEVFSILSNLKYLTLEDNKLTFDDLIPNKYKASILFTYTPQDSIGTLQSISLNTGDSYTLIFDVDESITNTSYRWYKDGVQIASTSQGNYTLSNVKLTDAGTYHCRITNSILNSLSIYSRPVTINVSCRQSDSLALINLYNATNGANWTNTWDLNQPIDTWYGVTLNSSGCVEQLNLNNNSLVGNLIDLNLPNLNYLYLSSNQLSGSIPNFSNLSNLIGLSLANNQLNGNIPDFTDFSNLTTLVLLNNQLSGSIPDFSNLSNLDYLDFSSNQLSGSIPDFSNLLNLTTLTLFDNQLSGNIPNFTNLTSLTSLALQSNQLSGSIPDFSNLSNLIGLGLADNQLSGNIPNFSHLSNLAAVNLYQNELDSCPSFSLLNLSSLLNQQNKLTFDDIIPNLGKITGTYTYSPQDSVGTTQSITVNIGNDYTINLGFDDGITTSSYEWSKDGSVIGTTTINQYTFNNIQLSDAGVYTCKVTNPTAPSLTLNVRPITITVEIPCRYTDSLALVDLYNATGGANWTYTSSTYLSSNQPVPNAGSAWNFGQPIDTWHGVQTNNDGCVTSLILNNNNLTGNLTNLNLSSLTFLILYNNQLSGSIPDFSNLPLLNYLYLSNNQFSGTIPDFSSIPNLSTFRAANNQLTGNIPDFTNLPNLYNLLIGQNQLTGNIPNFTNTPILSYLHLGFNQLTGNIPNFTNLPNLYYCYLYYNQLTGNIPNFTNLSNLNTLWASNNQLSGTIPNFSNLPTLETLILGNNQIDGSIPNFSNLNNLKTLSLYNNQLNGNIPNFSNLPNLETLWLSENQLSGSIPDFSNLTSLEYMTCNDNRFSNHIPDFSNMINLKSIYLYNNQLSGSIPDFTNLPNLEQINISNNKIDSCPNFSSLPNLQLLENGDNLLTFDDILPNIGKPSNAYIYSPQDSIGTIQTHTLNLGDTYTIDLMVDDTVTTSTYSWYRDGLFLTATSANELVINNFTHSDTGAYTCQVTNSIATGLTLYSRPVTLKAACEHSYFTLDTLLCIGQSIIINGTTYNESNVSGVETIAGGQWQGCDSIVTVNLTYPSTEIELSTLSIAHVDCKGNSTGEVSLTASGGYESYEFSNDGVNYQVSHTFENLSQGTYQFYVQDTVGCHDDININITEPSSTVSLSLQSFMDVDCNGNANGQINLQGNGGTGNLQYALGSGSYSSSLNFSNLSGGTYRLYTRDDNQCKDSIDVTIFEPNLLTVTLNQTATIPCFGDTIAAISSVVSGGNGGHTYLWDYNNQITANLSNLGIGTYSLTVTDQKGCEALNSITIQQPTQIEIDTVIVVSSVLCHGESNGVAQVVPVISGTPPYNYNWDNGETTAIASNLNAGYHTVTLTDNNGCSVVDTVLMAEPYVLQVQMTDSTNVLCNGDATGTATVNVIGGTTPYSYLWDNNVISNINNSLNAGLHHVIVTDFNNCKDTIYTTTLEPPSWAVIVTEFEPVQCFGFADGQGLVLPYTTSTSSLPLTPIQNYQWSNGIDTLSHATQLSAGWNYVTITNVNGCQVIDSVEITEPNLINVTATTIKDACSVPSFGQAQSYVFGGVSPYTYQWSNGDNTYQADSLQVGWHYVSVTDANNCPVVVDSSFVDTVIISYTENIAHISCFGVGDGQISISGITGGALPYTNTWQNTNLVNTTASNLDIGWHPFVIIDGNGCEVRDSILINQPPPLIATDTAKTKTCNPGNIGTAHALALGGTSPYSFAWDNGDNTAFADGLSQGYHHVTVTDANGCLATHSVLIDTFYYFFTQTINQHPSCFGLSDGSVSLSNFSGIHPPYTYLWDNGENTAQAINLDGGLHTVTITDALGCQSIQGIQLIEPDSLQGYLQKNNDVLCFGQSNGSAEMIATGGTMPYTVDWGGGIIGNPNNNLDVGFYSVTVTDDNGCTDTDTISISQPSLLTANSSTIADSCDGNSGSMSILESGGVLPYSYTWSPNVSLVSSANNISFGTYHVTVTDANGCQTTLYDNVQRDCDSCELFTPIVFTANPTYNYECMGDGTAIVKMQVSGGQPAYYGTGLYSFFVLGSSSPAYPQGYYYSNNGYFEFEVVDGDDWQVIITDSSGCSGQYASDQFFNQPDVCPNYCDVYPPYFLAMPDTFMVRNQRAQLWAVGNGTIEWTPSTGLSCTDCFNPISGVQQTTTYYISLIDTAGCEAKDTVVLDVFETLNPNDVIEEPIVVTPNGDGFNDVLYFDNLEHFPENSLTIFNRWGMKVYHVQNYDNTFNGTVDNVVKLPQGTYYFYLKPISRIAPQNNNVPLKGYFTLVR